MWIQTKFLLGGVKPPPTHWMSSPIGSGLAVINPPINTQAERTGSPNWTSVRGISEKSLGKWYLEVRSSATNSFLIAGVGNASASLPTFVGNSGHPSIGYQYTGNVDVGSTGATSASGLPALAANDILQIALDVDAKKLWLRKAGQSWAPSGDPAAGTGGFNISGLATPMIPLASVYEVGIITINAGQESFASAPPAGFNAWSK